MRVGLRHRWKWVATVTAILVALLAFALARPRPVRASAVERRDVVRTLVLSGRVRPSASPRLAATMASTVERVLVRAGERVSPGQLLVQLDDAASRAAVAEAAAMLAGVRGREQAAQEQAATAVRRAARELDRARRLYEAGAVSRRDVEDAERVASDARSAAEAANVQDAGGALAAVARARAALAAAEARLADTRIVAPVAGTVTARSVDRGDVVLPGQPLLDLAPDGVTEVVAFASEDNLADLRLGATARMSADAYPAQRFDAAVSWIAPAIDPSQGTVEVRLRVAEPPAYLKPDMTVSVNVDVARRTDALAVPAAAVRDLDTPGPWVLVARSGRAERRAIRVGAVGDSLVEVTSGLAAGERVLPPSVRPGARVRVRE